MSRIHGRALRSMALAGTIALSLGVGSLGSVAVAQTAATPGAGIELPPELPPRVSGAGAQPLSVNDCTVPEKSRDDVMAILRTPPRTIPPGQAPMTWEEPEIRPGAGFGGGLPKATEEDFDAVEAVLRQWQVCHSLGLTWQQMSLETDQFIREDIYGGNRIMTAYSDATLAELLDARAEADAADGEQMQGPGRIAQRPPMAIDRDGITLTSPEGNYLVVDVVEVGEMDGEQMFSPVGSVAFWNVDGVWLVDRVSLGNEYGH